MPELGAVARSGDTTPDAGLTGSLVNAPAPDAMDLQPGAQVGEYVVEERVGRGGMGSVYAAVHPVIGKKAAIKVIAWELCRDPAFVARFIAEARAVNLIGHPNIVESFSIGTLEDGRSYYVMEWLEGVSLCDRLRRGRVPMSEALAILDDTADALEAVHGKSIVHRDLTPRNLFLVADRTRGQTVKVFDFGLAKRIEMSPDARRLTQSGVMIGTPPYASPEQLCGDTTDHRSDIYSLGVIAYELLLGRRPYDDPQLRALITRKLTESPPPPRSIWPQIPIELEWLLTAMLAIDPARRPDLTEVRRALQRVRARPVEPLAAPPARRGGRVAVAIGVALLAAGLAITAIAPGQDSGAESRRAVDMAPAAASQTPRRATSSSAPNEVARPVAPAQAGESAPPIAEESAAPSRRPSRRARRGSERKATAPEGRPAALDDPDGYLLEPSR